MTGSFILDYYLLVVIASCGVFQVIGALQGFHGMTFFSNRSASIAIGLAALAGAFAWFFLSQPRNVPDSALGLNGNEQFAYFFAGSGTGLALTLILSSLRQLRFGADRRELPDGLDALRESTYLLAIFRMFRRGAVDSVRDKPDHRRG
ncbi:MAG: hypothetical protein BZY81_06430 [SAR202 cluster bacterium Io17-Chloro-G4]|nr:MAG: hypothetical protein BZY81_06430 [SAR202 cluster bacterium Io17-Chloro-G4]